MNTDARVEQGLPTGTVFAGRYEVLTHLGTGGMGDVYAVHDRVLGVDVALKMLLPTLLAHPASLEQFKEEVRLGRLVTHKNIARIYDLGVTHGQPYLTMEVIEGETLRKRMRRQPPLGLIDVLDIAASLAAGLGAAHEVGVVHRDLKPGNAMIDTAGRVRIIDFGGAALAAATEAPLIGTVKYMAPEQLRREHAGAGADVYSLGLIVFEMVAGVPPFDDPHARLREQPPHLDALAAVSRSLADVVARSLALSPAARPSAADVERALRAARDEVAHPNAVDPWALATTVELSLAPRAVVGARAHVIGVVPFRAESAEASAGRFASHLDEGVRAVLALTDGLKVATTPPVETPFDRASGLALDVDVLVAGSVVADDAETRIVVRVLDVESGVELKPIELVGTADAIVDLQRSVAERIAEKLRTRLTTHAWRGAAPADAVDVWLRARARARQGMMSDLTVDVEDLEHCVARAPGLVPAWAARALAVVRLCIIPIDVRHDWSARARAAVDDALVHAPDLPDTQLAAGLFAEVEGRFGDAVAALTKALQLAPAFAEAHEMLGRLEIESGRTVSGVARLRLAASLDHRCRSSLALVERTAHFRGRADAAARFARMLEKEPTPLEHVLLRLRRLVWGEALVADEEPQLRSASGAAPFEPGRTLFPLLLAIGLGGKPDALLAFLTDLVRRAPGSRYVTLGHQLCAEVLARTDPEAALGHVEAAAGARLFDLEWLDHCPPLASLRSSERFQAARALVAARVTPAPTA